LFKIFRESAKFMSNIGGSQSEIAQTFGSIKQERSKACFHGSSQTRRTEIWFRSQIAQGHRDRASSVIACSSNSFANSSNLRLTSWSVVAAANRRHRRAFSRSICAVVGVSGMA
jgi:hypothetical protein